ncbi:hypothetical protein DL98DRAFT_636927 [Cadophora sp. DSE1049]|nr:hypothetical protein DL98DRAFT_636927 [Cadophora sp. DSE1049]
MSRASKEPSSASTVGLADVEADVVDCDGEPLQEIQNGKCIPLTENSKALRECRSSLVIFGRSNGPLSSSAGVLSSAAKKGTKVIDLESDDDNGTHLGSRLPISGQKLDFEFLSANEKAIIKSEDQSSDDEAVMTKLIRDQHLFAGHPSKLPIAKERPRDFSSTALILPKVPGLDRNLNRFPEFPAVHIDPKDNQSCSRWIGGWRDRCPVYKVRVDGIMTEPEPLRPVESLLYRPLGPMCTNKKGEREAWMVRGQDWGKVHLVVFGVATESTKFVSHGENYGTSNFTKKQIRCDIAEVERHIALFKNAGVQVGQIIEAAMVKRTNNWRIALYREGEMSVLSYEAKLQKMAINAARYWHEIQKQLEFVYPTSGFQGLNHKGEPVKIKFWQLADAYAVYKDYAQTLEAGELTYFPTDFMLANLGIWMVSFRLFAHLQGPGAKRDVFIGFFLGKWRSAS